MDAARLLAILGGPPIHGTSWIAPLGRLSAHPDHSKARAASAKEAHEHWFTGSALILRQLIKSPGFTLTAILSLTLGIGAATAVFSVVYPVLMDPYPYAASDRMVHMRLIDAAGHENGFGLTAGQWQTIRKSAVVENAFASDDWSLTVTGRDLPEDVRLSPPGDDTRVLIIGVVGDKRDNGLRNPILPEAFIPYTLTMRMWTQILVQSAGSPLALLHAIESRSRP